MPLGAGMGNRLRQVFRPQKVASPHDRSATHSPEFGKDALDAGLHLFVGCKTRLDAARVRRTKSIAHDAVASRKAGGIFKRQKQENYATSDAEFDGYGAFAIHRPTIIHRRFEIELRLSASTWERTMTRWDDTVEFTQRIQQARDHEAICAQLLSITSRFGLSRLIAGTIPVPGNNRAEQAKNILFAGWPEAWMRRYLERGYAYVDPVLAKVTRNPGIAFTWREAVAFGEQTPEATRMMCEARDHGLTEGFAVPMMTLEGDFATISFGGEHMDLPAHAAGIIHLVGVFAVGRAFHMQGYRPRRHESLTSRERDCLIWCGEGKTDWEISVILGVSETTVRSHLNAARRKLQACNKTQMVAEAIRAGVIR